MVGDGDAMIAYVKHKIDEMRGKKRNNSKLIIEEDFFSEDQRQKKSQNNIRVRTLCSQAEYFIDIFPSGSMNQKDGRLSQNFSPKEAAVKKKRVVNLWNFILFDHIGENFPEIAPCEPDKEKSIDRVIYFLWNYATTLPLFPEVKFAGMTLPEFAIKEFPDHSISQMQLSRIGTKIFPRICSRMGWTGEEFGQKHHKVEVGGMIVTRYLSMKSMI
jgi:hypothetical protein